MLVIIAVAVLVKIFLGRFVELQGRKYNSDALVASGKDAMFDAVLSFSVLVSAIIYNLQMFLLKHMLQSSYLYLS